MLQTLHVKNLALVDETEVEFGPGLNILTGETGAGKSLILGSVNLALGGRFDKDMLRKGADTALVELIFTETEAAREKLLEMDIEPDPEGCILLSRKLQTTKSSCKINGETVTAKQMKELGELLLDIHGQHEHQSLLKKTKHREFLDAYAGEELLAPLEACSLAYAKVRELEKELSKETLDDKEKARELALAEFEWKEIEDANLKIGEDETLEADYLRMVHAQKIMEELARTYSYTGSQRESGASDCISIGVRALESVSGFDEKIENLYQQLLQIDSLLSDFNSDLSRYMSSLEFEEETFRETEDRLNTINRLKEKYGNTIEEILAYAENKRAYVEKMQNYDAYIEEKKKELALAQEKLGQCSEAISDIRRKTALVFEKELTKILLDLNFLSVDFKVQMEPLEKITSFGGDDVEFMISLNPGESRKPLSQVVSGGELSRIMLAIKTMLAGMDDIETLIFDEIDAGISGRTAWKVSERLHIAAKKHQVICITHLPQIAAMADTHFVIEKSANEDVTTSSIKRLNEDGEIRELARLLGSDDYTEAALENAKALKKQARG